MRDDLTLMDNRMKQLNTHRCAVTGCSLELVSFVSACGCSEAFAWLFCFLWNRVGQVGVELVLMTRAMRLSENLIFFLLMSITWIEFSINETLLSRKVDGVTTQSILTEHQQPYAFRHHFCMSILSESISEICFGPF